MKKQRNKLKIAIGIMVAALVSVLSIETVYAQDHVMEELDLHVDLQEDGSAVITERRAMNLDDDGTELFILLDESTLGESEITDFEVEGFEYEPNWDVDASFEEKAGRYGTREVDDGLELIWGMTEYGEQEYVLSYTISNLVRELEDGQALHWNFESFYDIPPENFSLEIKGPVSFDEENTAIWGFGFDGDIGLENGTLFWEAQETLDNQQEAIVLMQFEGTPFAPLVQEDMTFEEQQEMAEEGSGYNVAESSNFWKWFVGGIAILVIGVLLWGRVVANGLRKKGDINNVMNDLRKENKGKELGEIPYTEGEPADIAFLLHNPYIGAGSFEDLFFAQLLKWSTEEAIHIETTEEKKMFSTVHEATIDIQNFSEEIGKFDGSFEGYVERMLESEGDISYESALWFMLLSAADVHGQVTNKLMKKWAKDHAKEVEELADGLKDYSKDVLEKNGYMTSSKESVAGFKMTVEVATENGKELIDRLLQFKNYLDNLSLKEAASIDTSMPWEELVIWAAIFGEEEAEEILEDLEEFFPETYEEFSATYPHFYHGHMGYVGFRRSWSDGLSSGGYHASSGAGGMTSAGGGAGAGGGSAGGGAR